MNILPKKRWHVRTKDNIARVRRDEAKAAAEEKIIQQRAQLAEQEARTNFLRQQAALTRGPSQTTEENSTEVSKDVTIFTADKHINLFNEVEAGQKSWGENKEREAEKKEEQEKYEKNIGYLTYLGQTSLDTKGDQPWYEKSHAKRFSDVKESKDEVGKKTKTILDPINKLNKYLELCGKKPDKDIVTSFKKLTDSPKGLMEKSLKSNSKESKSHRKHKSKKKRKHKRRDSNNSSDSSDDEEREKKQKLEALRTERLRREAEERKKSEKLLTKLKAGEEDSEKRNQVPEKDGDQGYNSQFNPHLAKKPKTY